METYLVHVTLGNAFEDIYVAARNEKQAIAKARKLTTLDTRWANFIV